MSQQDFKIKRLKEIIQDYRKLGESYPVKFKNPIKVKKIVTSEGSAPARLLLKLFVANSSINREDWALTKQREEMRRSLMASMGHPLAIAADSSFVFAHPGSTKADYTTNERLQKPFVIGKAIELAEPGEDSDDWAFIYDVTDYDARQFLGEIAGLEYTPIPLWSSPQIVHSNKEDDKNIRSFRVQHNILTDAPVYGKDRAIASAICQGEPSQCMPILRNASASSFEELNNWAAPTCEFCIKDRLISIMETTTRQASDSVRGFDGSHISETAASKAMSSQSQSQQGDNNDNTKATAPAQTPDAAAANNKTADEEKKGAPLGTATADSKPAVDNKTKEGYKMPAISDIDLNKLKDLVRTVIKEDNEKQIKALQVGENKTKEDVKQTVTPPTPSTTAANDERLAKLEQENQAYKARFYKEDVAGLLLEYYQKDKAFLSQKGDIDQDRFNKALDYWVGTGKAVPEIKEAIEAATLMFSHQAKTAPEITNTTTTTKKASANTFEYSPTIPETTNPSQDSDARTTPYFDRSIVLNSAGGQKRNIKK